SKLDGSILLRNWPGEPRECVEIVRSIQAEAAKGVPFDQMAVLLNSPGEYRSHLEEAFSRAEIPAYFAQGTTAPDPAGRAMLALLSCAAEGLSARRFAEYLSLGQVPHPDASKDLESAWVGPQDEMVASVVEVEASEDTGTRGRGEARMGRHGDGGTRRDGEPVNSTDRAGSALVGGPEESAVIEGALRAPARWERLLVDSAVIGGRDRWLRRLEGLANELLLRIKETAPEEEAKVDSIKKQLRDLEALRAYALPLIERLANLPGRASWGEWLTHLRELAVNALRAPEGVLATLADLEPMERVGPVDLHEVQLVLRSRLHDLGVKPPLRRYGSVFVGSVDSARGLSFQVVFIPGLAERIFPRKLVEDPILPDEQRRDTATAGLPTRRDRLEFERLALRIALGSARERAYLSYPRIDVQQSRPRVPSFYALEALRAAEGVLPGFEEIASRAESTTRARLGWPAPERPEAAIDEAEYDLALLASLVEANDEGATGRAHYLLTANKHLARALRARSRRWLRRWTPNDGLVDPDELARQALASHQFSARSFSATALQNYASCPYRFFLSAILRLEMRQEPAAIEVIDPLTRGSLFHETQFEVLTSMKAEGLLPLIVGASRRGRPIVAEDQGMRKSEELDGEDGSTVDTEMGRPRRDAPTIDSLGRAFELVDRVLERLAGEYEDRLAPAIPRVWEDGINSIRADLREWLRRMAESDDGWVPEKFELSFGLTDRGPRDSDPDSVSHPVEIIGDFKLRGSIDLVERHASGKYRVTDHKTGKARAGKDTIVGGGKYLQPLLYALAAQKVLDEKVESGRLYYCTADGGYEERVVPLDEINLQAVTEVLTTIRQGLADAFLPAAPEEGACAWCDFLAVCGSFEEMRTSKKPGDRLVQLKRIRELP
ncbi:MAG: PD-(D/E)XK nuclease family protein, partial [Pyrinomonadaceae bacterium]